MAPQDSSSSSVRALSSGELLAPDDEPTAAEAAAAAAAAAAHEFFFLTPSAAVELPLFQYKGQDKSLTYKYVLSPLAEWCVVALTPRTIAPNTITLTGLAFMICSYASMWYHVPLLLLRPDENSDRDGDDEEAAISTAATPRWIFLFNCIAILIYQTLDNMDGKQARRVGASSPLGLLFDHGCDAINSVFGSANWMVAMNMTASTTTDLWLCFAMLMGPYALFYIGTWEEYYTGQLIMPVFNGPNEGLLGAAGMSLLSYLHGPAYWQTYSWWNKATKIGTTTFLAEIMPPLRNADILVVCCSFGFCQEFALKLIHVARNYGLRALVNILPFVTLVVCCLVVGATDVGIWLDVPRTSLHLCSFLFVEMTTELMLQHMTRQPYQPFRWILLPLVAFAALVASGHWPEHLSTSDFLLIYSTAAGTYLATKSTVIIHEICCLLGIWCFDIVTPRGSVAAASNGLRSKQE